MAIKRVPKKRLIDPVAANELSLYIDNTSQLYPRVKAIETNLAKKMCKGTFDKAKAAKLYEYLVDDGAKRYVKEFGSGNWHQTFDVPTRKHLASVFAADFISRAKQGDLSSEAMKALQKPSCKIKKRR